MDKNELVRELTKKLIDEGKLIEAGFVALKMIAMDKQASASQISDMRIAFFSGAHHIFNSITSTLDPGEEPTDADMNRINLIAKELDQFITEFERIQLTGKGPFQ